MKLPHRRSSSSSLSLLALAALTGAGCLIARRFNRDPNFFAGKIVLITGGSRGLGLALARLLRQEGASLALLARDADELERAARGLLQFGGNPQGEVFTKVCDLGNQEQVAAAVRAASERFGGIDVLINSAGTIKVSPLAHLELKDFEEAMRLHFWGALDTIWEVLPKMRGRQGARIVNIASIGGKVAVPHLAPYSASKFALVGLSDALRNELAQEGIAVTTVCPGLLRTGSHFHAQFKGQHDKEFDWFSTVNNLPLTSVSAGSAARSILEACRRGQPALTFPLQSRAQEVFQAVFPNLTARLMAIANRVALPGPGGAAGGETRDGRASRSLETTPAWKTSLSDAAAARNNEQG